MKRRTVLEIVKNEMQKAVDYFIKKDGELPTDIVIQKIKHAPKFVYGENWGYELKWNEPENETHGYWLMEKYHEKKKRS